MAVLAITADNFEKEVLQADKPVLIDFWASWCGPCRMFSPTIDEIATEYADEVIVGKVNVDEENSLAQQFQGRRYRHVSLRYRQKMGNSGITLEFPIFFFIFRGVCLIRLRYIFLLFQENDRFR